MILIFKPIAIQFTKELMPNCDAFEVLGVTFMQG